MQIIFNNEGERRAAFPVTREWVYFNHAAVGPLPAPAHAAARAFGDDLSTMGEKHWEQDSLRMEAVRDSLARLVGAAREEIAFTRNTSEGLSVLARGLDWRAGDNVVVPAGEFPANVYPWLALAGRGVEARFVPLQDGAFGVDDILRRVDARTRVVSVSSVQFHNGFAVPLADLGSACRERGVIFCVDAIQSLGAFPLDVKGTGVDFLACGAHKWLLSGEGLGFLYCRRDLAERIDPPLVGWAGVSGWEDFDRMNLDFREGALRFETGNLSMWGIRALQAALEILEQTGAGRVAEQVGALTTAVRENCRRRGLAVRGPADGPRGGITAFDPPGGDPLRLMESLQKKGVQVSVRGGAIRVSPHYYNTNDEIESLFHALDELRARG